MKTVRGFGFVVSLIAYGLLLIIGLRAADQKAGPGDEWWEVGTTCPPCVPHDRIEY